MSVPDILSSVGDSLSEKSTTETKNEQIENEKIFYQTAAENFVRTLCENIYTSKNVNFKDNFNQLVINKVSESLNNDPTTNEKIRDGIFGNDANPGLKTYIQDLFKISACSQTKENVLVYPFTSRVLQKLFDKDDKTIPDILSDTLMTMKIISEDVTLPKVLIEMIKIIEKI